MNGFGFESYILSFPKEIYFETATRVDGRNFPYFRENDKIVNSAERKLAELETVFLHLQQNIGIPEVTLTPHPAVAAAIKKAGEEGRRATVADLEPWITDANLNSLWSLVNRWKQETQKVSMADKYLNSIKLAKRST